VLVNFVGFGNRFLFILSLYRESYVEVGVRLYKQPADVREPADVQEPKHCCYAKLSVAVGMNIRLTTQRASKYIATGLSPTSVDKNKNRLPDPTKLTSTVPRSDVTLGAG
jgi:hypothetical protein